jgi:acyl carrier protein
VTLTEALIDFIQRNLLGDAADRRVDENLGLIDQGLIDSMGLMQLVTFIETQANVRVPDDEVVPENFQNVASIEQMVRRLQARR